MSRGTFCTFQRFLNCQPKRILIGRFALLLSVVAQGLDVRLAGMVSKAVVKMCRCFHTCWMTRLNNYAQGFFLQFWGRGPRAFQIGKISAVNHYFEKFSKQTRTAFLVSLKQN